MTRENSRAMQFAEAIVKAQGTLFVRELLRNKRAENNQIRIGATKAQTHDNLIEAVRAGHITLADLQEWNADVEGWGRQHVYLFRVPPKLADPRFWTSGGTLARRLKEEKKPVGAEPGMAFPDRLALRSVRFEPEFTQFIWHQRDAQLERTEAKDFERQEKGDLYKYCAYLVRRQRAVARFELIPRQRKAALFLQFSLGKPLQDATDSIAGFLTGLFEYGKLAKTNLSRVIKNLDRANADRGGEKTGVYSRQAKFSAGDAAVEFSAQGRIMGFNQVPAVHDVRLALDTKQFQGDSARFTAVLTGRPAGNQTVAFSLNRHTNRIYFFSRMTRQEVWRLLDVVKVNASKAT